jgi:hypothetical protein
VKDSLFLKKHPVESEYISTEETMIINSSDITLAATHSKVQVHEKSEELTVLAGSMAPKHEGEDDRISLTDKARDLSNTYEGASEIRKIRAGRNRGRKLGLIKNLLEEFTGQKIKIKDLRHWMEKIKDHDDDDDHDDHDKHRKTHKHDHHRHHMAWGINYNMRETYYERQDLDFNAGGVIRTADGREITFSLDLMMSRKYMSEQDISVTAAGIGRGPVIVDFQGQASELMNAEFNFGVETEDEGESETVSYLSLGNGLLTIDMNNDGVTDSTNELFGTATGNGFAELAAYDQDGNNWIDENDAVFSQLRLWNQGTEDNAVLNGLLDQNIGAIYLGNVDTPFDLKDSQNTLLGQVEKSGVYLSEDGTPGTIQQLSLIV